MGDLFHDKGSVKLSAAREIVFDYFPNIDDTNRKNLIVLSALEEVAKEQQKEISQ